MADHDPRRPATGAALTLVADVGGTNTRVAFATGGQVDTAAARKFRNADAAGLAEVLGRFHAEAGAPPLTGASVAVAGPVHGGTGQLTNLDWHFDAASLGAALGLAPARVGILNDLQAQGHALGFLKPGSATEVIAATRDPAGTQLVIGIGTGFNAAPVHPLPGGHRLVAPSECGHVTLPARTAEEIELSRFLARDNGFPGGFPGVEEALSGRGLGHVDAFLAATGPGGLPARDSTQIIAALAEGEPRAHRAAALFVTLLGRVAGDLALTHLPFGGIALIGGMARALAPHFAAGGFTAAFRDKGRFSGFMESFAVDLVEDDLAALIGCAHHQLGLSGHESDKLS
ncbi:glucokinase [Frigidibacter sp. MR17.24]|uniref:glucokinase n=1 Tax=Frigidibacter sp. MR17.24 TaxID=3127345 RepID=UPI003012EA0C